MPSDNQAASRAIGTRFRHGLLARTVVLEEESMLVESMAVAPWRQLRVWGVQKASMFRGARERCGFYESNPGSC